jgi:alkylation response protein AidB-like acyl-CoA dehydrogenase
MPRTIAREYGGFGAEPDLLETVIMDEEFNRAHVSRGLNSPGPSMLVPTLLAHGTEEQNLHFWYKRIAGARHLLGGPEYLRERAAGLQSFDLAS